MRPYRERSQDERVPVSTRPSWPIRSCFHRVDVPQSLYKSGGEHGLRAEEEAFVSSAQDLTGILQSIGEGDREAMGDLLPLVYEELHARASVLMRHERRDHTLQATALVNEAYMKLVDQRRAQWQDRLQFFAVASGIMRRILVDHAKGNGRLKRGGGWRQITLADAAVREADRRGIDVAALGDALSKLEAVDEQRARVVELRFFGGLTEGETGEILGVSKRTVERQWRCARTWLYEQLTDGD